MVLRAIGNDVEVTYGGKQGLSCAESLRPELLLLDLGMPEVARRIREQSRGKSIVISALTGWGQDEDRRRSKAASFDYHLVKPVDIDALRQLLAKLPPSPGQ